MDGWLVNRRTWVLLASWVMVLLVVVVSLIPLPEVKVSIPSADKWHHLFTYAFLGYWFLHVFPGEAKWVFWGLFGLGLAIELAQNMTGYRYMEGMDVVMNVLGVMLAMALYLGLKWRMAWLLLWSEKKQK